MSIVWITRKLAAEIIGCSTNTVDRLVTIGVLTPRPDLTWRGGKPSLDPDQVQRVAEQRAAERAEAEQRRRDWESRRVRPPDDDHEWLTASQVARLLGVSEQMVFKRTRRGTLPFAVGTNGRRWYRADHMEVAARARLARRIQSLPYSPPS